MHGSLDPNEKIKRSLGFEPTSLLRLTISTAHKCISFLFAGTTFNRDFTLTCLYYFTNKCYGLLVSFVQCAP